MTTIVQRSCHDNIKMSRQQLYREEVATTPGCRDNNCTEKLSRQHQDVATTIVQRRGRDNIRMSRQQLYREEVATTLGCRDNSYKDQNVATSIRCRDVIRGRDKSKLLRHHLHLRHVATTQRLLRQGMRQGVRQHQDVATTALYVATLSVYWASLLKSKKKCIEIRA